MGGGWLECACGADHGKIDDLEVLVIGIMCLGKGMRVERILEMLRRFNVKFC